MVATRARLRELFPDAADQRIAAAVAANLRNGGMSDRDIDGWLRIGADLEARLGDGRLGRDQMMDFAERQASALGLPLEQIATVGEIPMDIAAQAGAEPSAAEDAKTIADAEAAMKQDFGAYQRNAGLQTAYADALDRQGERGAQTSSGKAAIGASGSDKEARPGGARIAEIEKMMGDPRSAYWQGDGAESVQAEYRGLIEGPAAGGGAQQGAA
jgi:hypothetical protein